jgi:hypothetical protein
MTTPIEKIDAMAAEAWAKRESDPAGATALAESAR